MKSHHVGILGYGWAASAHCDAINATSNAAVSAICSTRPLDAAELKARHGRPIAPYQRYEDLLKNDQIDVIAITGYPSHHPENVIQAVEAGKHVIIEKPIALTWDACQKMAHAIRQSGKRACVCFEVRHSGQFQATKSLLDQGLLGELHYGEVDYYHGIGPWYGQFRWNTKTEEGGSSLLSAGCHALDALLLCMNKKVTRVFATTSQSKSPVFSPYEYPTTSVTLLNFDDGSVGKVASVIDCLQPYYFHTHLVGSEGSLLDNKFYSQKISGLKKEWSELNFPLTDSGDVADHPYQAQFESFFESLDKDEPMPLTDFETAYQSFKVLFAADLSAREKRPVDLEEMNG